MNARAPVETRAAGQLIASAPAGHRLAAPPPRSGPARAWPPRPARPGPPASAARPLHPCKTRGRGHRTRPCRRVRDGLNDLAPDSLDISARTLLDYPY
jgi:hypothetical protein